MKTNLFLSLIALLFFASCSDDAVVLGPTDFSYAKATFDIEFYTSGQTGTPSIDWNGSVGTFGLADSYEGVSINSTTGVVSWNKGLSLGSNAIQIIATNADGSITITITLRNNFSGSFSGAYNYDPNSTTVGGGTNYKLIFAEDGTMTAMDFTSEASGFYTINSLGELTGRYLYEVSTDSIYITGNVAYSNVQNPVLDGLWGTNASNPNTGYYKVNLD
ncbi:MAG: hypothetical protein R2730_14390 [Chitinophagales bacterium]